MATIVKEMKRKLIYNKTLKEFLYGNWKIKRKMISNDDGKTILGKVDHGEAKWDHVHNKLIKLNSPEEEIVSPLHLLYSEEGKVLFTNNNNMGELPFTRKYLYEFNDENLFSANVSFFIPSVKSEHLKHFHTMQLLNDGKTFDLEDHPCVDDMYRAEMNLVSNDEFFICWNVTGPNKNYRIETNYFRMMDESTRSMMKNDATTTAMTTTTMTKYSKV